MIDKAKAKQRAKMFIKNMETLKRPIEKDQFIFDYNGDKAEAELIWYFIDLEK